VEIEGATFLFALAALMITFGGFSALLLGIRQAAGHRSSPIDRYLVKTLLIQIFVLTAGSLLPPLLALYGISETWVWRGSALLFAIPMLGLLLTYPYRRRKRQQCGKARRYSLGNWPPSACSVWQLNR